ncbi:hypothetical protein T4A_6420 [Trichinella pseudospiralis]|uniref:Uncharacterized protein n=1 Tax=Trichinella pseudospiralis TaxID=6337 RepID=A0A0V1EVU7_TRIPS|nr:hypothetical protein T4A_6420 [Trichinella pseudospiralis]
MTEVIRTKFAYLLFCMVGKARGSIENISVTATNYAHTAEILRNRFAHPEKVAQLIKNLRCLTALGKDPFSGFLPVSEAMIPVIKDKFPLALQREWDLKMPLKSSSEADLQKFLILPRRILKSPSSKLKKPNRQKQRCLRERGSSHWAEACCHADNQDISVETALLSSKLALWAVLMAQGRTETLRSPQRSHFIEVADPAPEEAAGQEARL